MCDSSMTHHTMQAGRTLSSLGQRDVVTVVTLTACSFLYALLVHWQNAWLTSKMQVVRFHRGAPCPIGETRYHALLPTRGSRCKFEVGLHFILPVRLTSRTATSDVANFGANPKWASIFEKKCCG